jgi:hypothetical protein
MHDGRLGAEDPMVGVAAFNPDTSLVRGHHLRSPQGCDGVRPTTREASLRTPQQVHQAALAEMQPEQVGQRTLQPPVGQGLKGLEVSRDGMQPRPERRAPRRLWPWSQNARPAGRTADRKASMMRDEGLHRR